MELYLEPLGRNSAQEKGVAHVPYRNSKLTHLLQDGIRQRLQCTGQKEGPTTCRILEALRVHCLGAGAGYKAFSKLSSATLEQMLLSPLNLLAFIGGRSMELAAYGLLSSFYEVGLTASPS